MKNTEEADIETSTKKDGKKESRWTLVEIILIDFHPHLLYSPTSSTIGKETGNLENVKKEGKRKVTTNK